MQRFVRAVHTLLRIILPKNDDCAIYGLPQWSKIVLDDVPYDVGIDAVVVVTKHVSHRANI